MSGTDRILSLRVVVPKDATAEGFGVDDVRAAAEEAAERVVRKAQRIDDSEPCGPAANTMYRTTAAWAEGVDFCIGRLPQGPHVHGREEYGGDMSEYWCSIDVRTEAA
jgi:hypothetical protein